MSAVLENLTGTPFVKMTGSGNDFVFFDGRQIDSKAIAIPEVIRAICNRNNGIGADGIVILEHENGVADARIRYFNSDGSPADLCGNATLCSTTMSAELGLGDAAGMQLSTPAGLIRGRIIEGAPEIEMPPIRHLRHAVPIPLALGEQQIGFAQAGVPHLVVLCDDVGSASVMVRGPVLRSHEAVGLPGANVNWVSVLPDGSWRYRTFERGVEGETLACGTGAVAAAALLVAWNRAMTPIQLRTASGRDVQVSFAPSSTADGPIPTLRGEGRVVFRGRIATLIR